MPQPSCVAAATPERLSPLVESVWLVASAPMGRRDGSVPRSTVISGAFSRSGACLFDEGAMVSLPVPETSTDRANGSGGVPPVLGDQELRGSPPRRAGVDSSDCPSPEDQVVEHEEDDCADNGNEHTVEVEAIHALVA